MVLQGCPRQVPRVQEPLKVQETPDMRRVGIIVVQGASRRRSRSRSMGRGRSRSRRRSRREAGPEAEWNETGDDFAWPLNGKPTPQYDWSSSTIVQCRERLP